MQTCPEHVASVSLQTLFCLLYYCLTTTGEPNLRSISIDFCSNSQEKPGHVTISKAESIPFHSGIAARINA